MIVARGRCRAKLTRMTALVDGALPPLLREGICRVAMGAIDVCRTGDAWKLRAERKANERRVRCCSSSSTSTSTCRREWQLRGRGRPSCAAPLTPAENVLKHTSTLLALASCAGLPLPPFHVSSRTAPTAEAADFGSIDSNQSCSAPCTRGGIASKPRSQLCGKPQQAVCVRGRAVAGTMFTTPCCSPRV